MICFIQLRMKINQLKLKTKYLKFNYFFLFFKCPKNLILILKIKIKTEFNSWFHDINIAGKKYSTRIKKFFKDYSRNQGLFTIIYFCVFSS